MRRIIFLILIFSILINAQANNLDSKLTVTPYGFFKLDMSYDDALISTGNFARWVIPQTDSEKIPATNITAKQSRFGMDIKKGAITGKIEIDFYGAGGTENKAAPMMRKAYAEAKLEKLTIRAGQDSDVISPLVPATINYPVAWWAGDIGYRRPMLKIFNKTWAIAFARNIGGDINGDGIDDGTAGLFPELQGRFALNLFAKHNIGFSGHYALRDADDDGKYSSWSANIDLSTKLTSAISFSGEFYLGSNMASMLGGIGNSSTVDGVESQGGWVNLKYSPKKNYTYSAGVSMDDPCDCDLPTGARSKNTMIFGNMYHEILQGFLLGFEVSYWSTDYKDLSTANALRAQIAFLYKF